MVQRRECWPSLLVRAVDWPVYLEDFEAGHAGERAGLDCGVALFVALRLTPRVRYA